MGFIQRTLFGWSIWEIEDKELLNLLKGRKGGKTTMRILDEILEGPKNKNQISKKLKIDYNTVTYHVNLLTKHEYIIGVKLDHCTFFHPSEKIFKSKDDYNLIKQKTLEENKE